MYLIDAKKKPNPAGSRGVHSSRLLVELLHSPKFITTISPEYGIRIFHPWTIILHTGWKVVFWKARYIRFNKKSVSQQTKYLKMEQKNFSETIFFFWKLRYSPAQKSCFHPVCRVIVHEWDLGLLQKLHSWLQMFSTFSLWGCLYIMINNTNIFIAGSLNILLCQPFKYVKKVNDVD